MAGLTSLPRGAITDISGPISSGRTALVHAILAEATEGGEYCAVVDCRDAFDPVSASEAGVDLRRVLWVRAGKKGANYSAPAGKSPIENPIEKAMKAADMILHSGGFGVVVLDLCEMAARELNSIPLSYWYRFRRAVENTPSRLVVASHVPLVKSCAPLQLETRRERAAWEGLLFAGIDFHVETRKQRGWMVGQALAG
jgi:recombination protein RecA